MEPKFENTGVIIPEPCKLISTALTDHLIGPSTGNRNRAGDHPGNTRPECEWTSRDTKGHKAKQGKIYAHVSAQTKRLIGEDEYLQSKAGYSAFISGKKCRQPAVSATQACWYSDSTTALGVVIRKGYFVVWVSVTGSNSPGLTAAELPTSADRVAEDIVQGLP
ncbi:hypothetical protein [Actinomadura sp. 9N407]|uniref:hypothetical protein n=1 Tax=Actinomadura sp. 9N407 TaxID=3375154 RepID=UPI0037A0283B